MYLAIDSQRFLERYWQREPLFLPGGMVDFAVPADASELAGLALESGVDARIIRSNDDRWELQRAPFGVPDFQQPGAWTLLVQAVDHHWDEAAELLDTLPFLPRWRLADVMMSYATDGGSAGPHYDLYDVFIIQGEGERRWRLGQRCDADVHLLDLPDLRLLREFEPSAEYRLRCGDVLYIPPGVAHWGVSEGESTSFSIGLRAPRIADFLARWADTKLETLDDAQLYGDPARSPAARAGEFTDADVKRARDELLRLLEQDDPRWFGEVISDARGEPREAPPLPPGGLLCRVTPGRIIAWHDGGEQLLLCAAGDSCYCPSRLRETIATLCSGATLSLDRDSREASLEDVLQWLHERGVLETA